MADARSEEAASDVVDSVHFRFYMPEEVRSMSVKRITKPDLLDTKNTPVPDGLYDPALGPLNDTDPCKSCGQLSVRCPGHCGHIDLAKPLYNPLLFRSLQNLLRMTCLYCHKFKLNEDQVKKYIYQLDLIAKGDVVGARNLEDFLLSDLCFPEEDSAESTASFSNKSISDNSNLKHKAWTSFQYAEALYVLSKFMGEKRKKCDNCGRKNPKITSPTFGFLNKETSSSDVRANVILEHNLVLSSGESKDAETTYMKGDSDSQIDEELPLPTKAAKGKNLSELPPELIKQLSSAGQKNMLPTEVELILKDLWKNQAQICNRICDIEHQSLIMSAKNKGYSMFFLKTLLVPPNRLRPPASTGGHEVLEHPQNILLSKVQEANIALRSAVSANPDNPEILRRWMDLQKNVNVLFDSSKGFVKSEKEANGIRQMLEKKSGILRQKMMGKRVNFACRSVISPDPYLAVNEIGIPPYFALRLSYPERVTPWNVTKLRHAVINGADIHPGATHYKDKDRMCKLQVSQNMRASISRRLPTSRSLTQHGKGPEPEFEGKVVYRHLQDGDIVLVNRQPTLHKASMMAHVVRVLKGEKTIRMHYANCSTYNADFDGDEMNVHLPQDEVSRSEAINIVDANKQYIVPTNGEPIRGLIQDHIVSAVLLTKPDTFFTREEYFQLLQVSCVPVSAPNSNVMRPGHKISPINSGNEIQPVDPAILKPIPLWTGKQVITAILNYVTRGRLPFTIKSDGRIQKEYLKQKKKNLVRVYDNELIDGIIDKAQFGSYGLVHAVQELYGADTAGVLLSIFSRLFTSFLQMHGFTCGIDDLLLVQTADKERNKILGKGETFSKDVHVRFSGSKDGEKGPMELQREIERVIRVNGESATIRLDRMMSSSMNTLTSEVNQCLFPYGLMKPFPKNCLSLMTTTGAKGGLVNMTQISSMLGQQELEGKRVPRMISGKSLPCFPPWDISSRAGGFIADRFLTGLRPQEYYFHCMAGRDGLVDTAVKTSRSGYLQRCLIKNLEGLKVSYDHTVRDVDGSLIQFTYGEDGIDVLKASFLSKYKMLANNKKVIQSRNDEIKEAYFAKSNGFIEDLPYSMEEKKATKMARSKKDEHRSLYQINRHELKRSDFKKILKFKYFSSLAEPGEPVGVVAAQSIGEPSTQMTLNTFHLAGKAEANVTLGIPRLQEILMTASDNIRTPVMVCPLFDSKTKDDAECLAAKLRRVSVADVVERMEVCSVPFSVHLNDVATMYKLKMTLYPSELYPPHSTLTIDDCVRVLRTSFIDAMEDAIGRHLDMIHRISDISSVSGNTDNSLEEELEEDESGTKSTHDRDGDGDNDDESDDDQGTDAEKRRRQASDEVEYDDDMQKESSNFAVEHDGEPQSEYESGVDQVDADEDYLVGEGFCSSTVDSEGPESPTKPEATPDVKDSKKKSKSSKKGKRDSALESKKKQRMSRESSRKTKRAVFVSAEGLKFEVHFVLQKEPCILLAEIAQKTAKNVFVKQSKNISRCSVPDREKDSDPFSLHTSGVNFLALWDLEECLDLSNLYSNDIHAMLKTYGVEAARATIIKEVTNVFKSYGIKVNTRHLSLIADFMTFQGGYRPMNRLGMGEFSTSPFGKMTFETATKFIVESAFHGEVDTLESPSASVCLGQPVKMGTGCFDLLQNLKL